LSSQPQGMGPSPHAIKKAHFQMVKRASDFPPALRPHMGGRHHFLAFMTSSTQLRAAETVGNPTVLVIRRRAW